MTLAERIMNMTDRAQYERLANMVLRQKYPLLSNLIAGGINEKGETVKGKLDAFTLVEGQHYILVEHTTNDSSLESKWLYDQKNYSGKKEKPDQADGDLIKAIKEAETIRQSVANAKFTIYLTCNQSVSGALWAKVGAVAAEGKVEVELLELSNIAEHLNFDPRGQFLRKVFFNIDYDLLSPESLQEIQVKNLARYAVDGFIQADGIETQKGLAILQQSVEGSAEQLLLMVADSGIGKTTLCYAYMAALQADCITALRATPQLVDKAIDLEQLIELILKATQPALFWNEDALALIHAKALYLFVDDLNNFSNPLNVLDKLIAWSFARSGKLQNARVICPIWPQYYQQIPNQEKKKDAFAIFHLRKPNKALAIAMLRKSLAINDIILGPLQEEKVAKHAGNDPLLIGIMAQLITKNGAYADDIGSQVIQAFFTEKLTALSHRKRVAVHRFNAVVTRIGECMFREKTITPSYDAIVDWLAGQKGGQALFDEMLLTGDLFLVNDEQRIQFRHDRIRSHILVLGICALLNDLAKYYDAFGDPFFAPQIGASISLQQVSETVIDQLLTINPESVFHSLAYLQAESEVVYFERIVNCITAWKDRVDFDLENDSILYGLLFDLLGTDTKKIKLITDKLPKGRLRSMAEMRNGNLLGAVLFFAMHSDFEPDFGDRQRDDIIRHIKTHHPKMVAQLAHSLNQHGWEAAGQRGAYLLAGYLADPVLLPALWHNWQHRPEDENYPHLLWGMLHCSAAEHRAVISDALAFFHTLPDEGDEDSGYPKGVRNLIRYWFSRVHWRFKAEQIVLFDELYDAHTVLLSAIYAHIDHPLALERTVLEIGENLANYPNSHYAIMQPDDRWDFSKNNYRLSEPSRSILRKIWSDRNYSYAIRRVAFRFWAENEENEVAIRGMQQILSDDQEMFESAVWRCAFHGDQHVIPDFLNFLLANKFHWMRIIQYIWNDECKAAYQQLLDKYRQGPANVEHLEDFAEVLREIPGTDAEELLIKNWSLFDHDESGIQTALFIATERTKALALAAIQKSADPSSLFHHIDHRYACHNTPKEKLITLEKLQALEPYLQYLSDYSTWQFADQCLRSHFQDWLYQILLPYLSDEKRRKYAPTVDDLIDEIEKEASIKNHFVARHWLSDLQRRQIPFSLIKEAVVEWVKKISTNKQYRFLADFLTEAGSRKDLALLKKYQPPDGDLEYIQKVKAGATYDVKKRSLI